jgi:hypothetical protein
MKCKILGVRHNTYFDWQRGKTNPEPDTLLVEEDCDSNIKQHIIGMLFEAKPRSFQYLLVKYNDVLYYIERDSDTSYVKQVINYHPLMENI